jgi:hypothetical protein
MARRNVRELWKAKLEGRLPPPGVPVALLRAQAKTAGPVGAVLPQRTSFSGRVLGNRPELARHGLVARGDRERAAAVVLWSRTR